jgi:hypothetical protein
MEFLNHLQGVPSSRPSLFEIMAQDKMRTLLKPSLQSIVNYLTERYPRYWIRLSNRFEEVYVVLMLVMDGYYLGRYGGSFTETFYGMKRTPTRRLWSLLMLVGMPYGQARIEEYMQRLALQPGQRSRVLVRLYPYVKALHHVAHLVFSVLYMFDYTHYPSPSFYWLKIQLERSTPSLQPPSQGVLGKMLDGLQVVLPTALFFYSFMEWWYTSDYYKRLGARPIPPAPRPSKSLHVGKCPLCTHDVTNPACLYTGYVFCYPCIYKHVQTTGKCPVTGTDIVLADIRKVYMDL